MKLIFKMGLFNIGLAIIGAAACPCQNAFAKDSKPVKPLVAAIPMKATELFRLYGDKSWIWPNGAGFFAVEGRRFTASTGTGEDAQYAEGRWALNDAGRMCMHAVWHGKAGAVPNVTCFDHRTRGGVIYQKRVPRGRWYVFRSDPTKPTDEYTKLRNGNLVGAPDGIITPKIDQTGHKTERHLSNASNCVVHKPPIGQTRHKLLSCT